MKSTKWLAMAALFCWAGTAQAGPVRKAVAAAGGVVLGQVKLGDAKDRDVVALPPCKTAANVKVTKLRVVAKNYQAEINRLKVTYYNGQDQVLNVRETFRPGTDSRWIDLNGDARCIKKITIVGDTNTIGWKPGKQATIVFRGK